MLIKKIKIKKRGVAMLFTVLIISMVLAIAFGVFSIFIFEIKVASQVNDSVISIFAADSGIEKKLYDIRINNNNSDIPDTSLSNGAIYNVTVTSSATDVKSIGRYKNTKRSLEVSL